MESANRKRPVIGDGNRGALPPANPMSPAPYANAGDTSKSKKPQED